MGIKIGNPSLYPVFLDYWAVWLWWETAHGMGISGEELLRSSLLYHIDSWPELSCWTLCKLGIRSHALFTMVILFNHTHQNTCTAYLLFIFPCWENNSLPIVVKCVNYLISHILIIFLSPLKMITFPTRWLKHVSLWHYASLVVVLVT